MIPGGWQGLVTLVSVQRWSLLRNVNGLLDLSKSGHLTPG